MIARLVLAVLLLLPLVAHADNAFEPVGPTVSLAVTGATARVQFQASSSPSIRIYNSGTVAAFIVCGGATVVATTGSGLPVAPGTVEVLSCGPQTYVAGISAGTALTLYITPGAGI
jgi:hypothetical protein